MLLAFESHDKHKKMFTMKLITTEALGLPTSFKLINSERKKKKKKKEKKKEKPVTGSVHNQRLPVWVN